MSKSGKKVLTTAICMCVLAAIVITAFVIITKKQNEQKDEIGGGTEAEKLIAKDLENNYPGTPREVLKLYSRISKCLYSGELKDGQLEGLAEQIRLLFDDELLAQNPEGEYLEDLRADVEEYKELKKTIISYVIQKSSSVKESTVEGKKYATIIVTYMLREKSDYVKSYEEFVLREDEDGHWKILGWKLLEPDEVEEDDL